MGIVYMATCLITSMEYIGITKGTFEERKRKHISCALNKTDNYYFHNALRSYGLENFKWKILHDMSDDMLPQIEQFYIALFHTKIPEGYNMTDGGEGTAGHIVSEDTKEYLRLINAGKILTEEHKNKIGDSVRGEKNGMFGKHHTEESKQKSREKKLGKRGAESPRSKRCKRTVIKTGITQEFESTELAADYLKDNGYPKATGSSIRAVCNGRRNKAYDSYWEYI